MQKKWHQIGAFLRFYLAAQTRYQVHSPFVFDFVNFVLEDQRWYYAFEDIEALRREMRRSPVVLDMADHGAATLGTAPVLRQVPVRQLARTVASSPAQGRLLFRLAQWMRPERILELGTSVGIGTMYLASAAPNARFITLEGSEACAHVARTNLGILDLHHRTEVVGGAFQDTLLPALQQLGRVDMVFFDGHHTEASTGNYLEQCLAFSHERTVLVFDDVYWSPGMTAAWEKVKQHPKVTCTVDIFDLAVAFLNPDLGAKQHFRLVPGRFKPWKNW
ncbi:MAG: class I SAM-dependent methyltransferase [Lewinellaceae bacterium]|nr:class I SAM-dependent methyltransferase [Lewinellaceae bacterium]